MTLPRWTLARALAVPLLLAVASCRDAPGPTDLLDVPMEAAVVVDFQAGEGSQFVFLPPLHAGQPAGPLGKGLDLSVSVCDPSDDCQVLAAKEEDDHYHANWKSSKAQAGTEYTITVTGSGVTLGRMRITLEANGKDKAGSTFPIKFWVGETLGDAVAAVADCVGDDRCNAEPVPDGTTTSIVTLDENGGTMGQLIFPDEAVPAGGLIVTLDCREGGYAPGEGPLPTDLDQWPLFCHVDVRNPDGSEYVGSLPDEASIEICVVDDDLQPSYHGFVDHHDLLLGKSHTGSDFMFLPEGPESLDCTGATTTVAAASPVERVFGAIGSRLARVLSPVLPQKLYARSFRFRDGGVGGLVSSFSDINPVEPAYITGTVTDGDTGDPIAGIVVTLGGDATGATATDAGGNYTFGPLQAAAGGGSSYTVTVTGPPVFATPSQAVLVTGSGTFTADFASEVTVAYALVPASTFDTPAFGGLGGSAYALICPAGYVGVGINGTRTSWYGWSTLWNVSISCRELLPDGDLGASTVVGTAGGGGGTASNVPFSGTCAGGQVLVAISGYTTTGNAYEVNTLAAACATVTRVADALGGSDSSLGPWSGSGAAPGPVPFNQPCGPGYAVTGLVGRQGNILDSVGLRCTQLTDGTP